MFRVFAIFLIAFMSSAFADCAVDQFLQDDVCVTCPANSVSNGGAVTSCECAPGFTVDGTIGGATETTNQACKFAPEFSVTINMTSASNFAFSLSAAGTFYIDWGDGTIENKPKGTSNTTYSHPYKSAGTYTIGISGDATAYSTSTSNPAISFKGKTQVTNISGSLGAIFPTLPDGTQPRFINTFYGCKNLTGTITSDLFDGIHGQPTTYMFKQMFENCDNLSGELPYGLFDDLSGTLTTDLFYRTFKRNALSGTLTPAFFGGLTIDDWNSSALEDMFDADAELATSCPDGVTAITNATGATMCESAGTPSTPTCNAGYWLNGNTCEQCPVGSYCANNIKTECDAGYTTNATGASERTQCYTECTVDCEQSTCPENATCEYGDETANGTQNWGGACNAVAPTCSVTITCNAGYWLNGNTCEICPVGSYCANNIKTECDAGYTTNTTGVSERTQCYTECTVDCEQSTCPENATCEYGNETANGTQNWGGACNAVAPTCSITTLMCDEGYWLNGNTCEICPVGSYCANNIKTECDAGYTTNATGASERTQCYTECTVDCEQSTCPENATCEYGNETANGTQNWGGACNAVAPTCSITNLTCDTGYHLNGMTCELDGAKCDAGYWLNGDTCEICPVGSYCVNDVKTECDAGYTTNTTGASERNQCYTTCSVPCIKSGCQSNAVCEYDTTNIIGEQFFGG